MMKRILPHALGALLVISTVYHSDSLYSVFLAIPFFLISFMIEIGRNELIFPTLIFTAVIQFLLITSAPVSDFVSVIIFLISFGLPLSYYWLIILSQNSKLNPKPVGIATSYVVFTFILFYFLPDFIGVSEFIFGGRNEVVQILIFLGSGMLVGVVYHAGLEIKD